ncbi:FAD-dependent monooxygenase [Pseudonocardia xinjiangensis]|uniref:FAD-dependent monooxygenase n=1 Tax=Pseudonocardia xinjiangensis TaxID=75289 RepID=UPI003D8F4E6F
MPESELDVLVVGAGPTGLTLACALAAEGVTVRVVDRATGPAPTSRANILHARGVEVLGRVGALAGLRKRARAPIGMTMHVRGRPIATMRFVPDPLGSVQALFVSQADVEAELRRRLTELGVEIEWGTAVTALEQDAAGVTAVLDTGTTVRAQWLVGCDGARSTVRDRAGIAFPGVAVVEQFLLADVRADWARDPSASAGWFHPDGLLLTIPMPDTDGQGVLWRLMADVPATVDRRLDGAQIVEHLVRILQDRAGETDVRIREVVWTSVFRIHRRLAADYRRGRILLAGDAAHIHSPIGGQGMNTGIGDAENLAWKLALVVRRRAGEALLDTYAPERRPLAAGVLRSTTANTRILVGEGVVTRFLRDRVFVPVLNLPAVQRRATRGASQLWVSYRNGPLGGSRRGGAPRPGDRVPDRDCTRPDGTSARLHSELGPGWVLLAPRPEDDPDRNGGVGDGTDVHGLLAVARDHLGDRVVLLHPAGPDRKERALLVRPDGHLCWRGCSTTELHRLLTGVLQQGRSPT